jgi:spermidine synthase
VTGKTSAIRILRTRRGARLVQEDVVLSEVLKHPGATDDLFDLLAAPVMALQRGPRLGLLGFAAGGMIAPLRAMGFAHPVRAVDSSRTGVAVFRELARAWAGDVRVDLDDAARWLRRRRRPFDCLVEDLSAPSPRGVTKPPLCLGELPELIAKRLRPGGLAVINLLKVPGVTWRRAHAIVSRPHTKALVIHHEDFENRIVLASDELPSAAAATRRLRDELERIGSLQAPGTRVRTP